MVLSLNEYAEAELSVFKEWQLTLSLKNYLVYIGKKIYFCVCLYSPTWLRTDVIVELSKNECRTENTFILNCNKFLRPIITSTMTYESTRIAKEIKST